MFKVTLLGQEYRVAFQHFPNEAGLLPGTQTPYKGYSLCRVWQGENLLLEGKAFCSINDQFSKVKGRRVALTDALSQMFYLTKDERRGVWQSYLGGMTHV